MTDDNDSDDPRRPGRRSHRHYRDDNDPQTDRIRYFTSPHDGNRSTHHRRAAEPFDDGDYDLPERRLPPIDSTVDTDPTLRPVDRPRDRPRSPVPPTEPPRRRPRPTDTERDARRDDATERRARPRVTDEPDSTTRRKPKSAAAVRRERAAKRRKKRRIVVAAVLVTALVALGAVGYAGAKWAGMFEPDGDYTNEAGTGDALVHIPENSSLTAAGGVLVDKGVVESKRAFINAASNATINPGYYKLRTGIPAKKAMAMLTAGEGHNPNRIGLTDIGTGRQLDTKTGADKTVRPGIFELISRATSVDINGKKIGVTVQQLAESATNDSAEELGIPDWAKSSFAAMKNDHRRIEGLIASKLWDINPEWSAREVLRQLITQSAKVFDSWGLTDWKDSDLPDPYEALVSASIIEREVQRPADFPMVARVIVNRLKKDQRLEMDSTINYTANTTDIDVHGETLATKTKWNTYFVKGLPPTPIGAVGEPALRAAEHPARGNWLYFVSVDSKGTTKFTADFEQHKRNRNLACKNGVLRTNCSS